MSAATRLPPLLMLAIVLHTAVFPELRLFGVAADVMLLLAVTAGIAAGPERGAAVGFITGLLADLFLHTPFGVSALANLLVGYAVGSFQSTILHSSRWIPMATTAVASAIGIVLFAAIGAVVGQEHLVSGRLLTVAVVVGGLNAALALPALHAMRWSLVVSPSSGLVPR